MQTVETIEFGLSKEITAKPLAKRGFNKHYINLVSADVFKSENKSFLQKIKSLFSI